MLKPGVWKLFATNSRIAGLPTTAELPGGKTAASSAQKERTRSTSRLWAASDHSASSRRICDLASLALFVDAQPITGSNIATSARPKSLFILYRPQHSTDPRPSFDTH